MKTSKTVNNKHGANSYKFLNHLMAGLVLAATVVLIGGCQSANDTDSSSAAPAVTASAAPITKEQQVATTPEAALAELEAGNARFVSGHPIHRDFQAAVKASASGQ